MTIINSPFFIGKNTPLYEEQVQSIYTDAFLKEVCNELNLKNPKEFYEYVTDASVSYLTAKDNNSDRIRPAKQKTILKNYENALKETLKRYQEVQRFDATSSNYHDALKETLANTEEAGIKKMFDPYVTLGDGNENRGSISITLFEKFLTALIEATEDAPDHAKPYQKAYNEKDYVLWWVARMGKYWTEFTDTPFILGDWYTNEDLGSSAIEGKKGRYISTTLDVLYNLLHPIDKKITHSDIETSMRKYKKM